MSSGEWWALALLAVAFTAPIWLELLSTVFHLWLHKRDHKAYIKQWPPRHLSDRRQELLGKHLLVLLRDEDGIETDFDGLIVDVVGNTVSCRALDGAVSRSFEATELQPMNPDISVKLRHRPQVISGLDFIAREAVLIR